MLIPLRSILLSKKDTSKQSQTKHFSEHFSKPQSQKKNVISIILTKTKKINKESKKITKKMAPLLGHAVWVSQCRPSPRANSSVARCLASPAELRPWWPGSPQSPRAPACHRRSEPYPQSDGVLNNWRSWWFRFRCLFFWIPKVDHIIYNYYSSKCGKANKWNWKKKRPAFDLNNKQITLQKIKNI